MKKIKINLMGKKNQRIKSIKSYIKNNKTLKLGIIIPYRKINYFENNNIQKSILVGKLISSSLLDTFSNNIILNI